MVAAHAGRRSPSARSSHSVTAAPPPSVSRRRAASVTAAGSTSTAASQNFLRHRAGAGKRSPAPKELDPRPASTVKPASSATSMAAAPGLTALLADVLGLDDPGDDLAKRRDTALPSGIGVAAGRAAHVEAGRRNPFPKEDRASPRRARVVDGHDGRRSSPLGPHDENRRDTAARRVPVIAEIDEARSRRMARKPPWPTTSSERISIRKGHRPHATAEGLPPAGFACEKPPSA